MQKRVVIVGGGAAGIFAAILCKESAPSLEVIVLEKTRQLLSKVRISGGGRCNVTHAQFDPKRLVTNYPRGSQELLGPFHHFQPQDTIAWFKKRGVTLKTEKDGRIFPVTDSSETIIHALLGAAKASGVIIHTQWNVTAVALTDSHQYQLTSASQEPLLCDTLILATGGFTLGHELAKQLGHTLIAPVPSLFTFNVPTSPLKELSGISLLDVEVSLPQLKFSKRGPLLITHFGFSGPAILKLSAFAARELHSCHYQTLLKINWLPDETLDSIYTKLVHIKKSHPLKSLSSQTPFQLPLKLWKKLVSLQQIPPNKPLSHISHSQLNTLAQTLTNSLYSIEGKTTHKEEFVTCGGVDLKEINCKTMQSKLHKNLFFAGELLNIDGITGGFNFQNAWTSAYLAASAIQENI